METHFVPGTRQTSSLLSQFFFFSLVCLPHSLLVFLSLAQASCCWTFSCISSESCGWPKHAKCEPLAFRLIWLFRCFLSRCSNLPQNQTSVSVVRPIFVITFMAAGSLFKTCLEGYLAIIYCSFLPGCSRICSLSLVCPAQFH